MSTNMDTSPTYQAILTAQRLHRGSDLVEFLDHVLAQFCLLADASGTVTPATVTTSIANAKSSILGHRRNY